MAESPAACLHKSRPKSCSVHTPPLRLAQDSTLTTFTFVLCLSRFFMQTACTMPARQTTLSSRSPDHPPGASIKRFLPRIGSPAYHVMLSCVAILILGPLGGVSAAFMNFSIGFFIGGQVLAGILGSTVTLPYGPEGRHGANYMQTMAASVAGLCGMGVLAQAMVWLGLPEPPAWKLVLYLVAIGVFGAGVVMLYTHLLVDRMQFEYTSAFAVDNILRA